MEEIPRQYAMCKFKCRDEDWIHYPFTFHGIYVFLGDIPNMPHHCVVADYKTGQIYSGYHTDSFEEIPEDET